MLKPKFRNSPSFLYLWLFIRMIAISTGKVYDETHTPPPGGGVMSLQSRGLKKWDKG